MSSYVVFRLIPCRPTLAADMTDAERAVMVAHSQHWNPLIEAGKMVVFGPVADATGSWGLAIVETDDEAEVIELSRTDPAITSGLGSYEMGRLLAGFVRLTPASRENRDAAAVQMT